MVKNHNHFFQPRSINKMNIAILGLVMLTNSLTWATYNKVGQGVVRIELTKQYVPHVEITDLEESEAEDMEIRIEESSY